MGNFSFAKSLLIYVSFYILNKFLISTRNEKKNNNNKAVVFTLKICPSAKLLFHSKLKCQKIYNRIDFYIKHSSLIDE